MENLQPLLNLKKLYIGHNKLNVLEGLANNVKLEELHIEKQKISDGVSFCFDPRTVIALKVSFTLSDFEFSVFPQLGLFFIQSAIIRCGHFHIFDQLILKLSTAIPVDGSHFMRHKLKLVSKVHLKITCSKRLIWHTKEFLKKHK